ncbi:MAG: bifunctional adenosylcobinamide kinase/adenosylcobinamide-phosphate guanylyltransferase [Paracoccaceae bacterium]
MLPPLTFILGGAASGKSKIAENLVISTGRPRVYLATAQAFDDEMKTKVAAHLTQRGSDWTTIEEPVDVASRLTERDTDQILLLDCVTLWLSNIILAERDEAADGAALMKALEDAPCPVVVVSNEVGLGIVPDNALSRRFRGAQGRLNQALAAQAGLVVNVVAGLPQILKGTWPE